MAAAAESLRDSITRTHISQVAPSSSAFIGYADTRIPRLYPFCIFKLSLTSPCIEKITKLQGLKQQDIGMGNRNLDLSHPTTLSNEPIADCSHYHLGTGNYKNL